VDKKGKLLDRAVPAQEYSNIYTTGITTGGFNYHESLVSDLVSSGVNVLTTANNHAFDRGMQGLTTTAKIIVNSGAVQVGSLLKLGDPNKPFYEGWYRITETNGWRVAWVGCTMLLCSTCRWDLRVPQDTVERRVLFCDHAPLLVYRLSKRKLVFSYGETKILLRQKEN